MGLQAIVKLLSRIEHVKNVTCLTRKPYFAMIFEDVVDLVDISMVGDIAVILRWVGGVFQHGTVSRDFTVKVDCAANAVVFWNSSGNTCR